MTSKPAPDVGRARSHERGPVRGRDSDMVSAAFGYLGAIVLGPVVPLLIYLLWARRSPFVRYHAATAVNISLTSVLYSVCCLILAGLLLLDNITVALVIAIPAFLVVWVSMLKYLIRGVDAASCDEKPEVPSWICARIVS